MPCVLRKCASINKEGDTGPWGDALAAKNDFFGWCCGVIRSFLSAPPPPPSPARRTRWRDCRPDSSPLTLQPCRFANDQPGTDEFSPVADSTLVATLLVTGDWPFVFLYAKGKKLRHVENDTRQFDGSATTKDLLSQDGNKTSCSLAQEAPSFFQTGKLVKKMFVHFWKGKRTSPG